jgi:hypothetical protein
MTDQSIEDASRREFLKVFPEPTKYIYAHQQDAMYREWHTRWGAWQAARQSNQSEPVALGMLKNDGTYGVMWKQKLDFYATGKYQSIPLYLAAPQQAIPSGWVSVKDSLPNELDSVLVFGVLAGDNESSVSEAYRDADNWYSVRRVNVSSVTHWMPLPASPTAPIESDK